MSVERGALPTAGFTIVPNEWLRDPRISWKAKGLLAYIASHQEGYRLTRRAPGAGGRRLPRPGEGARRGREDRRNPVPARSTRIRKTRSWY